MQVVVTSVSVRPNLRAQKMRLVEFQALSGDAFVSDESLAEGMEAPPPVGSIALLVSATYAKRFHVGGTFDLILRERE